MADTTESKKYLIDIQSNYQQYIDDLKKAREELDKLKIAQLKLTDEQKKDSDFMEKFNAQYRNAQTEVRNATKILDQATLANKAQKGSYEELYRTWQVAQTQLKLMGSAYTTNAQGIRVLSEKYIESKKAVEEAKRGLDAFGKGIADNRLNVGNYGEAVSAAFANVRTSVMATFGPAGIIAAVIGLALKLFNGLKEAVLSTTAAMNAFNIVSQTTKQVLYDIATTGKFSIDSMIKAGQAAKLMNEERKGNRKDMIEFAVLEREIAMAEFDAADKTKTLTERQNALNLAISKQNELSDKKIKDAQDDLRIIEDLIKLRPKDEKLRQQQADAIAKIINLDKERFEQNKRNESKVTQMQQNEIERIESIHDALMKAVDEQNEINAAAAKKRREQLIANDKEQQDFIDREIKRMEDAARKKDEEIDKDFKRWSDYWDKIDAEEADRNQRNIDAGFEYQRMKAQGNIDALNTIFDAEYGAMIASVEYQRMTDNEKLLLDQQYTDAKNELSLIRMDQALQEKDLIANILGSLSGLFGKQTIAAKALSIAQATISTYTAGVKAMAELPLGSGPILRFLTLASVIAAGLLQVKNIIAVKVPGGGGEGGTTPTAITSSAPMQRAYAPAVGSSWLNMPQLTQSQVNALPNQNPITADDIANAVSKLPAPVVTVEDINARSKDMKKVEVRANI